MTVSPGGSAMFVSGAAAYLGAKVGIIGNVGEDYPQSSLGWLKARGVDLELLKKTRAPTTRFRITQYDESRRLLLVHPGRPIRPPRIRSRVLGAHLGPVFNEISNSLARNLRDKTAFLSLDLQGFVRRITALGTVQTVRRNLSSLLKLCDVVQASIEEAEPQTSTRNKHAILDRLLDSGPKYCIVTLGKRGSMLGVRPDERFLVPAFPDKSIADTTGAGDVFAGSWLSSYLSTKDPVWAAAVGSAFASLASRKTGLSKFRFARSELFRRSSWVYNNVRPLSNR